MAREIAIDIDGVVFDFVSAFCAVCQKEGYSLKYDQIIEYHMGKVLGVDDEEFYRLLDLTYESDLIKLYPEAAQGLQTIREGGWKISFVTSRPERLRSQTIAALEAGKISYDRLIFAAARRKVDHVTGVQAVIEDSLEEAHELLAKGLRVIMFRHPWNAVGESRYPSLIWICTWSELVAVILGLRVSPSTS